MSAHCLSGLVVMDKPRRPPCKFIRSVPLSPCSSPDLQSKNKVRVSMS